MAIRRGLTLPAHIAIQPSGAVTMRDVEEHMVDGEIPVYIVRGGSERVLKAELVFRVGKLCEQHRGAAHALESLLCEATESMPSGELTEALEYYGATVRVQVTPDALTFSLHCLSRFFEPLLALVREMILTPVFPEREFERYRKNRVQRYRMMHAQNDYLASRHFAEHVFGAAHPYGYTVTPEDVLALTLDDVASHHRMLGRTSAFACIAGDVGDSALRQFEALIHDLPAGHMPPEPSSPVQTAGQFHYDGPQPHQVSVRVGKQIISRTHRDYPGLFLLTTILGGYFGSRLIRNLREDLGLTYNIHAGLDSLLQSTCLVISTDANAEARKIVLREIYREIAELRLRPPDAQELEMVRNYVCGNFLMQIDGPFNVVSTIKPLILHGLPVAYFDEFIARMQDVTPRKLQRLARSYFNPVEMTEVVVGA